MVSAQVKKILVFSLRVTVVLLLPKDHIWFLLKALAVEKWDAIPLIYFLTGLLLLAKHGDSLEDQEVKERARGSGEPGERGEEHVSELKCLDLANGTSSSWL